MQKACVGAALAVCVVQSTALQFGESLWVYALVSVVFASCFALLLALLHPAYNLLQASAGSGQLKGSPTELMNSPIMQQAIMLPTPPSPWGWSVCALLTAAVADGFDGLRVWLEPSFVSEVLHHAFGTACAAAFVRAVWRLGGPPSRVLRGSCWAVCGSATLQVLLTAAGENRVLADDAATPDLVMHGMRAARALACTALLARSLNGLLGCLVPARQRRGDGGASHEAWLEELGYEAEYTGPYPGSDRGRWLTQVVGAALLLGSSCAEAALAPADVRAACASAQRLGIGALACSAWLALHPDEGCTEESAIAAGSYKTVDEMRAARRAARAAKGRSSEQQPAPLMLEVPAAMRARGRDGGVQSLDWHEKALCRDADGDVAHEFWEAIQYGLFRRCGHQGCSAGQ